MQLALHGPRVTLRSKPLWGFHFTPEVGLDATHYGTSLRLDHGAISRALGEFSADLRPPSLERIFARPVWGYRVKHVVEPDIRYRLVRASDREEIDNIIKRIHRERSCAILLVEQNLQFVRDMTQRFAILETGRIAVLDEIGALTEDIVRKHLSV